MSSINPSTRYSSFNSQSSSSSRFSNPSSSSDSKNPRRPLSINSERAVVPSKKNNKEQDLIYMMKKLMEKDLGKTGGKAAPKFPRKLFQKGADKIVAKKAVSEGKENTRTLGMVLRSERELLSQKEEYEMEIMELKMIIEEKNYEVEKLKDLCLKQREEIKALKSAILFPDVMNTQLQELFNKQGSELKQAKQIIPTLQKQVTSLSGQLQCFAEDLAEVKAEKHATRACYKSLVDSPITPTITQDAADSLEYSSANTIAVGSSDDMFLNDFNPCLTPYYAREKSMESDDILDFDSPQEEWLFQGNKRKCEEQCLNLQDWKMPRGPHISRALPGDVTGLGAPRLDEKM